MAIMTVHEIRDVFKLPLRQCEGFVNAIFKMMNLELQAPSFIFFSAKHWVFLLTSLKSIFARSIN